MVKGITHILKNNAAIQGIVGQNVAGDRYKVYPAFCPQPEKFPYIVVKQTGKTPIECKGEPTSFIYTYDVYSFDNSYDKAETLDAAVVSALNWIEGTYNGVEFQEIRHQNTVDGDFIPNYAELYSKISSFEAMVDEG